MLRRSFLKSSAGTVLVAIAMTACDDTPTAAKPPVDAKVTAGPVAAANPKASSHEIVSSVSDIGPGFLGVLEVLCPTGKKALGGGFWINGSIQTNSPDVVVYESSPRVTSGGTGASGWRLVAVNRTADTWQYTVYAICATI